MSLLQQLSSQSGDRSEHNNRRATELILENPDLIKDIAAGLDTKDYALLGDCVEVFTMVAESDRGHNCALCRTLIIFCAT